MVTVRDLVLQLEGEGKSRSKIADIVGVSEQMVSMYIKNRHMPTLRVAVLVYCKLGVALYPYDKEALENEKTNLHRR